MYLHPERSVSQVGPFDRPESGLGKSTEPVTTELEEGKGLLVPSIQVTIDVDDDIDVDGEVEDGGEGEQEEPERERERGDRQTVTRS